MFIHFPKNGGTFVSKILRRIHDRKPPDDWRNRLYNRWLGGGHDAGYQELQPKHGTCNELPLDHHSKRLVSTIRDPFERYVSSYFFGWWKRYPEQYGTTADALNDRYPHYPDLRFDEFVQACCEEFSSMFEPDTDCHDGVGWYSRNVLGYYFRNPASTCSAFLASPESPDWKSGAYNVTFLHTEQLNEELHSFLLEVGYDAAEVSFILDTGRIRPKDQSADRGKAQPQDLFTPALTKYVLQKERLFFELFEEYKESNSLGIEIS